MLMILRLCAYKAAKIYSCCGCTCCEGVLARVLAVVHEQRRPFLPRSIVASEDDSGALRHGASKGTQPSLAQLLLLLVALLLSSSAKPKTLLHDTLGPLKAPQELMNWLSESCFALHRSELLSDGVSGSAVLA
jgi:hypothetical protein